MARPGPSSRDSDHPGAFAGGEERPGAVSAEGWAAAQVVPVEALVCLGRAGVVRGYGADVLQDPDEYEKALPGALTGGCV